MRIRPHHLLCISRYIGKGYSEEFVRNMEKVIARLHGNEGFSPVFSCDEICRCCPYNENGTCLAFVKVDRYDQAVARLLQLQNGKIYRYADIADEVRKRIFATEMFREICADCSWSGICHKEENDG